MTSGSCPAPGPGRAHRLLSPFCRLRQPEAALSGVSDPLLSLGLPTWSLPALSTRQALGVYAGGSPLLSTQRPRSPDRAAGGEGPWGLDPPSPGPRARPPTPARGARPARRGGNEYGSRLLAADASSPTGARNIKLQGTGHHSQLKFLLFPWKESRRQPGPWAKNLGPGDSGGRARGLRRAGLAVLGSRGPGLGGHTQGCPGEAGTALLSQGPERRAGLLPPPTGTHSCGQPCLPLPACRHQLGRSRAQELLPSPQLSAQTSGQGDRQTTTRAR